MSLSCLRYFLASDSPSHQVCSDSNRYNKRDVDFSTLREYNDYLEQVEDIGKAAELEALRSQSPCTKKRFQKQAESCVLESKAFGFLFGS